MAQALERTDVILKRLFPSLLAATIILAFAACGGDDDGDSAQAAEGESGGGGGDITLRLAYFPNITHSQALIGLQDGSFAEALGDKVSLEPVAFNAGTEVIEAIFAGEIDLAYIGPNPTINGYVQSDGEALRVIAGATSGGALLVVHPDSRIESAADLAGKKIATPALGNTQDVALRTFLLDNDLASRENGGNVEVVPAANPDALALFLQGEIDGAWVPEPWATRLVQEGEGEVLVDERDLWPGGRFVTTQLIVATEFLEDRPDVVQDFLSAHVDVTEFIRRSPDEAKNLVNTQIAEVTGEALPEDVIDAAWENFEVTHDPIASSLIQSAADAYELDFLEEEPDLEGLYALELLNEVLAAAGLPEVDS
jgi:sulfonate transport system substrate-binding protein